jgi:hypothetical protein
MREIVNIGRTITSFAYCFFTFIGARRSSWHPRLCELTVRHPPATHFRPSVAFGKMARFRRLERRLLVPGTAVVVRMHQTVQLTISGLLTLHLNGRTKRVCRRNVPDLLIDRLQTNDRHHSRGVQASMVKKRQTKQRPWSRRRLRTHMFPPHSPRPAYDGDPLVDEAAYT